MACNIGFGQSLNHLVYSSLDATFDGFQSSSRYMSCCVLKEKSSRELSSIETQPMLLCWCIVVGPTLERDKHVDQGNAIQSKMRSWLQRQKWSCYSFLTIYVLNHSHPLLETAEQRFRSDWFSGLGGVLVPVANPTWMFEGAPTQTCWLGARTLARSYLVLLSLLLLLLVLANK